MGTKVVVEEDRIKVVEEGGDYRIQILYEILSSFSRMNILLVLHIICILV